MDSVHSRESLLWIAGAFPTAWECVNTDSLARTETQLVCAHTHTRQGEGDCYTLSACKILYRCPYLCCQVEDMIFKL